MRQIGNVPCITYNPKKNAYSFSFSVLSLFHFIIFYFIFIYLSYFSLSLLFYHTSFYFFSILFAYSRIFSIVSLRSYYFIISALIFRKHTTIYKDPWRIMSESSLIAVLTKGTNMIVYHRICVCMCACVNVCVSMFIVKIKFSQILRSRSSWRRLLLLVS